ncbi:protein CLT3, chloroplastic-like isoform X1 [Glycine soja]|uniref:Protein CLT3, chloroplastic n=1 Tax=Glycine soja TaxID=3848 RepID=A0A445H1G3_GLYSO|nr:protein CLT3, chloroplastic-like isoform X1 [Glycine soja]RZB67281.1 Protein CLT3, chloroplastic [Glycine soja]
MASLCRRLSAAAPAGHFRFHRPAGICAVRYGYSVRRPMRLVAAGTTVGGGAWVTSDDVGGREEKVGPCSYAVEDRRVAEDGGSDAVVGSRNRVVEVAAAAVATVVLGVGNRVLYKLALVPLKHYPFFLAQLATFGYVIVYFAILYIRHHAGIVTDEMLDAPKAPFIVVGLLEALAAATGMAAGAILSGASIPILSQTFLVWQILLSIIFLGRRYKVNQLLGCFLVTIGVVVTVASGAGAGNLLKEGGMFWSLLMIVSFFLQAADTVLKEIIFLDSSRKLKGGCCMDLFVVNSYGSAFQALFVCLLLPFLSKLWGIPFSQLPNYLKDGAACFLNFGTLSSGCDGAPLLPLLFIIVNIGFNIALLHLLKISSAVVSCLASTFSVPISIYVFTMPLPYLGVASSLPTGFMAGAIILILGLLIYAWTPSNGSSSASFSTSST